MSAGKPKRDRCAEEGHGPASAREPRKPDMEGGVWFTLSLGRKQRADPKWLLPMICKAGGVSKRDVGSIRIDATQTRFEIAGDKAAGFAGRIGEPGSLERGIVIAPAGEASGTPQRARPKFGMSEKPGHKPSRKPHRKGGPVEHRPAGKPKGKKPKRPAWTESD